MTWSHDQLAPADRLLFRSDIVKAGCFSCGVDDPSFRFTECLDNDVFVLPTVPLWIRRNKSEFRFVEPGGILIHRAGNTLERRSVNQQGDTAYWFAVHPDIFEETLGRYALSRCELDAAQVTAQVMTRITSASIRSRLALLARQLQQGTTDKLVAEEEILSLFFAICEQLSVEPPKNAGLSANTQTRRKRLTDKTKMHLNDNLAESLNLADIATAVGTSVFHLCRIFRQEVGLPLHEYRTRQRLGYVVDRLLLDQTKSLTQLALDTGFSSHSHFSRVFAQQIGVSPSDFRSQATSANHNDSSTGVTHQ